MGVPHSLYRDGSVVTVDRATCKHCGRCAAICPADVLEMHDGQLSVRSQSPFGCIACGHCMMVCPHESISVTGRGICPDDLLTMPSADSRATPESLAALMESRRSVRRFTDAEVPADVLDAVIEMAASAPMGIPPWDVGCTIVRGRARVRQLADEITKGYEGFLRVFRPWVLSLARPFMRRATHDGFRSFILPLARVLVESHQRGQDVLFWDAPAVMIFHHSAYVDRMEAAIACTYAMLAAESLGLGTTMIGSAAPILQRNVRLKKAYGIPESNTPALVLIVGYPAARFKRNVRRHFSVVQTVE